MFNVAVASAGLGGVAPAQHQKVPRDLIMVSRKTTLGHTKNMYPYRHIINKSITSQAYSNEGEAHQFVNELEVLKETLIMYAKMQMPGMIVNELCCLGF
jgi:hypothetical protein